MDVSPPVGFQIARVDLKLIGGRFQKSFARFSRRPNDCVAHPMGSARGERSHIVRPGIAVRRIDMNIGDRHAERLRRNLACYRLHALA